MIEDGMLASWRKHYIFAMQEFFYLFKSNVDSNWNTCAREKTVRVFFFRFDCIDPFAFGEPLSDGRSGLSGPSSSIISCPSSSESFDVFIYDEWSCGECFAADVSGLTDGDAFSVVFVDELSIKLQTRNKKTKNISELYRIRTCEVSGYLMLSRKAKKEKREKKNGFNFHWTLIVKPFKRWVELKWPAALFDANILFVFQRRVHFK